MRGTRNPIGSLECAGDRPIGFLVSVTLTAWFVFMIAAGADEAWRRWQGLGPLSSIQTAIVLPPFAFALAWTASSRFRSWLRVRDLAWLMQLQVLRVFGASHLVSWGMGRIAGGFAWPVALGNIAVGLLSAYVALHLARGSVRHERWAHIATWVGLGEFGMTIRLATAGAFTAPLSIDPPVAAEGYASMTRLPVCIFPTFLIPFFIVLHLATFVRLGARH